MHIVKGCPARTVNYELLLLLLLLCWLQLDPHNSIVLGGHLLCAAKELPLLPVPDGQLFGQQQLAAAATQLAQAGLLGKGPTDPVTLHPHPHPLAGFGNPTLPGPSGPPQGLVPASGSDHLQGSGPSSVQALGGQQGSGFVALHYTGPVQNPAGEISLRTIDPERFIIYNSADERVLEEIEANMAFYNIYDGAVYLYQVGTARGLGGGAAQCGGGVWCVCVYCCVLLLVYCCVSC
jgi:hypothetical protein